MSDNSVSKRSSHLRPCRPPPPEEKKATEVRCRRRKQVTAKSVIEKKINSDHPSLVVHDDPEPMCRTIRHYSSPRAKVVLTKLKPEVLQSLSDHIQSNRYTRAHRHSIVSSLDEKETKPPSKIKTPVIQTVIDGHNLPSSEDKKVCRTFDHYSSMQPKVVLTRLKFEVSQLLSGDIKSSSDPRAHHPVVSPLVDKETEPSSRRETPVAQTVIDGHDLSSSDDEDDNNNKLDANIVHHSISHYRSTPPKVVLPRMKPEVPQSSSDHSKRSRYPRDNLPTFSSLVDTKENEPPNKIKAPVIQAVINGPDLPSPENDNVHTTCHSSALQPEVVLSRITTKSLDSVPDPCSPNSNECFEASPPPLPVEKIETEQPLRRERPPVRLVARKKTKYYVSSSEDEDENRPRRRRGVQKSCTSESTKSRYPRRRAPSPPPPRREKPAVRVVAQARIYYGEVSSEEETGHNVLRRRRDVQKELHESEASFSSESDSSYGTWKSKRGHQKKENEAKLKKEAIKGNTNLSEYEKQRKKNIEDKLAFLESLKKLDEANFSGSADN